MQRFVGSILNEKAFVLLVAEWGMSYVTAGDVRRKKELSPYES
jgi:hypothetical protein